MIVASCAGLANEVFDPETLVNEALQLADRIASNPRMSVQLTKECVIGGKNISADCSIFSAIIFCVYIYVLPRTAFESTLTQGLAYEECLTLSFQQ